MMKNILIVLLSILLPVIAMADNTEKMNMIAGQTELLRNLSVDRISIGNPEVVEVEVLSETNEILVQALNPGFSDLRLWKNGVVKQFIVEVLDVNVGENLKQIRSALSDIEGIKIRGVGQQVLIEGEVYRQQDADRITAIAQSFSGVVPVFTKPNLDMRNVVSMDVRFVEINKNVIHNIGIDWANAANGLSFGVLRDVVTNNLFRLDGAPGQGAALNQAGNLPLDYGNRTYSFLGVSSRVDAVINMLSSNGYARVLAEPKLSCVSGGEAEFLAGGEVPIPVITEERINVDFKEYGIVLKIQPQADSVGNISTGIEMEVSNIDDSVSVLGIPGFLTRRTITEMNVRDGETIILSGLFSKNSGKDVEKIPGLGHIPIIGELFKSRRFRNNLTELYVFVTPSLVDSNHETTQVSLKRAEEVEQEHKGEFEFDVLD